MKIAYLARRAIPSVHAHAVQIVKMCEAFGRLGHEVTLFSVLGDDAPSSVFERYGVARLFDIQAHPKRMKYLQKPRFVAWLLRQPSIRRADIYFGRDIRSLDAVARFGRPVIYEAHAIPRLNSKRWHRLSRLFARDNFSHLVCVTSTLADLHREQFSTLASKPIVVIPNAAGEIEESPTDICWPGRPNALQVGFVGRPYPGKGIEMIVAAASALPDLDFHVVGAASSDLHWIDSDLPANLHLHGYRPHGELGSYFRKFDIAVAPYGATVLNASRSESAAITSPLKLLEYMAAGLPTIISELPGVRDIITDRDNGFAMLVRPGDEREFIDALSRISGDAELRRAMGKAARDRYLERHTMVARAKAVLNRPAGQ